MKRSVSRPLLALRASLRVAPPLSERLEQANVLLKRCWEDDLREGFPVPHDNYFEIY